MSVPMIECGWKRVRNSPGSGPRVESISVALYPPNPFWTVNHLVRLICLLLGIQPFT